MLLAWIEGVASDFSDGVLMSGRVAFKRIFVRSVTNFVIGYEWFCSVFKLKMGDSSRMV